MKKKKVFLSIFIFILPIILALISFILLNKPIERLVSIGDFSGQYIGLFSNFQQILKGKESILYSFSSGLGSNFLMDYYYYLSSPFNILLLFCSKQNLINMIAIIILLKFGFSSISMSVYLKKKFNISSIWLILLSCCYALNGYFISFYSNLMWLDAIVLMPLLLLSVDEYLKVNKKFKYMLFASLLIISNYYIAYMCILFSFIYFLSKIIFLKNRCKKIFKFALINFIVILICSFVLLPVYINVLNLSSNRGIDYLQLFSFKDEIKMIANIFIQLLPFSTTNFDFAINYIPNIYCTIFVFLLCTFYFRSKNIDKKEKISSLFVISVFIISFLTNIGNYILNCFSHPFGYYFRFSFMLSLYMIIIAAKYLEKNNINYIKNSFKTIIIYNILFIVPFSIFILLGYIYNLFFILFLLAILNLYFYIINNQLYYNAKSFKLILFALVILELFLNCYYGFRMLSKYYYQKESYSVIINNKPQINDNYRYIYNQNSYRNLSLLFNTKGSQYSSSNINYGVKDFYQKIGAFVSGSHYYLTTNNTSLIKKILSIKYEEKGLGKYSQIYNTLNIGYMVKENYSTNNIKNPFEYQNRLLSSMVGRNIKPLKPYDKIKIIIKNGKVYEIYSINNENKYIYFYCWQDTKLIVFPLNFATINIDKKEKINYNGINRNGGIMKLKNSHSGIIEFYINNNVNSRTKKFHNYYDINENWLYYEDDELVDYTISELTRNQLNITKMDKNILEGNINVEDRKILFLSIPYEEGWTIYVDGKKTDYFKIYDAFIGVNMKEGHHDIKMVFYPKGLKEGIIISGATLIAIIITSLLKYRLKKGM